MSSAKEASTSKVNTNKEDDVIEINSDSNSASSQPPKRTLRDRQRSTRRTVRELSDQTDRSEREKCRPTRKSGKGAMLKYSVFDGVGAYRESGVDACECWDQDCPGCFYPCPVCNSRKCGVECRVNRKMVVAEVKFDGSTDVLKNPYYD